MEKTENKFLPSENCPIRNLLCRLGDKWSMLVLISLHTNGVMRFNDIYKSIGDISQRMLTVTLRSLEADGLVSRKIYPEVPPKVEYTLTKSGESLMPHFTNLVDWALENLPNVVKSRKLYETGISFFPSQTS
ncbi:MAG: helix-turn-helix transcriptional regulator [Bacteroidales bacterium]|jgi:DNA-binding HxlR family transcriptional regulator|nr:helix-turn-helix transcriptional regulator [Bacteroidales bacterium]